MKMLAYTDVQGDYAVYSWLAKTARRLELDAFVSCG